MKVLVINCGSSSLKYQVLDMTNESLLCKGLVERIGMEGSVITHEKTGCDKFQLIVPMEDHKDAISHVLMAIQDADHGVVKDMSEIGAVGHRVVHAGEKFAHSVLIDDAVIKALEECIELAPLHNPPNLLGIAACQELMPDTPMVGVFDTAFHQTMPPESYIYALPYEYYEKYGVRRYGFHGTSHKYVSERAADMLNVNLDDLKLITCHLGNGASVSAIKRGKCIDTSMGFTPLAGVMMGTRSGTLDPSVVTFLMEKENLSPKQMSEILNKKSGMLGVSCFSGDDRDIYDGIEKGDEKCKLARDMQYYQIRKFIGGYVAAMDGVDAIIFTGGIGENSQPVRADICTKLNYLGVKIDLELNEKVWRSPDTRISTPDSKVDVWVIPTNEELMIARDTKEIVDAM